MAQKMKPGFSFLSEDTIENPKGVVPEFEKIHHQNTEENKVDIEKLESFKNHPFRVLDDEKMEELVESIKLKGILIPIIVRKKNKEMFEIIAGHRRSFAAKKAGLKEVPVQILDVNDEEATIIMTDTNIQRERLLPSEKAYAYKMRMDAIKKQGQRTDLDLDEKTALLSVEQIGSDANESKSQIKRYIRLTELFESLLLLVDDGKLPFFVGVELSYLSKENQEIVHNVILAKNVKPSVRQAEKIRGLEEAGKLNFPEILNLLSKEESPTLTLKSKDLDQYFSKKYSKEEKVKTVHDLMKIFKSLEEKTEDPIKELEKLLGGK